MYIDVGQALLGVAVAWGVGFGLGRYRRAIPENPGEVAVRRVLMRAFPGPDTHLLNHLTLPYQDGTTEIDHVLVARTGIFVIETKHYSGTIQGTTKAKTWTKVLGSATYAFQNPLLQNFKHEKAVEQILDEGTRDDVHGLVVMTGSARFQDTRPENVVDLASLVPHIEQWQEQVLSRQQVHLYVGRLECTRRQITRQTDVEHQAYLQRKFGESR